MDVLRCVTFLAPNLFWFYDDLARRLGGSIGCRARLVVGRSYAELADADVAFVCGLPYVEATDGGMAAVEPLAAPVLHGARYGDRPVYFSDVIVRRDSRFQCFDDLRDCSWAYNERLSQSGFGITRYHLFRRGESWSFFGRVVEAGWHERSIDLVATGAVDASAIDSHVLAIAVRDRPALANELRVLDALGPSTIQPVVVARRLLPGVKRRLQAVLLALAHDLAARSLLRRAFIQRFERVSDADYDDIRRMRDVANAAGLPQPARV